MESSVGYDSEDSSFDESTEGSVSSPLVDLLTPSLKTSSSSSAKEVRFALSPERTKDSPPNKDKTFELPSPETDLNKSREELLEFVNVLREKIGVLTCTLSGERMIRKKKDKTIFKLVKQCSVKLGELTEKEKEISQLLSHQANLETQTSDLKQQLKDLQILLEKRSKDHHSELTALQNSNRMIIQKYDDRISSLQAYNSQQCEDLRRQVLHSQLEADRVRLKVASLEMKFQPRRADRIMARTMKDATKDVDENLLHPKEPMNVDTRIQYYDLDEKRAVKFWRLFGVLFSVVIIPVIVLAHKYHVLNLDAMCAPCRPYTTFDASTPQGTKCQAPWWAPASIVGPSYRQKIFHFFCENRRLTRIDWIDLGNGSKNVDGHKLVVHDASKIGNDESNATKWPLKRSVMLEKRTSHVRMLGGAIEFRNYVNKKEKKRGPWSTGKHWMIV